MNKFIQKASSLYFTELESDCLRLELAHKEHSISNRIVNNKCPMNQEDIVLPMEVSVAISLLLHRDALETRLAKEFCLTQVKEPEIEIVKPRQEKSGINSAARASKPRTENSWERTNELTNKQRLWSKFRCNPHAYFADSKVPGLRILQFLFTPPK